MSGGPIADQEFVKELADAFWRISGNYADEGTCTPGGRFYEKTLESVLAEYALRECRRYLHFRPDPMPDSDTTEGTR